MDKKNNSHAHLFGLFSLPYCVDFAFFPAAWFPGKLHQSEKVIPFRFLLFQNIPDIRPVISRYYGLSKSAFAKQTFLFGRQGLQMTDSCHGYPNQ